MEKFKAIYNMFGFKVRIVNSLVLFFKKEEKGNKKKKKKKRKVYLISTSGIHLYGL